MVDVKRHGHEEKFDERKIYASCYAACVESGIEKKDAEKICERIAVEIQVLVNKKKAVTSDELFKRVILMLKKLGKKKAAAFYVAQRIVVKRKGGQEKFDERKVYASCYSACLNCELEKNHTEKICERVAAEVKKWATQEKSVNSDQIFKKVIEILKKLGQENVAFMYETHRDIS